MKLITPIACFLLLVASLNLGAAPEDSENQSDTPWYEISLVIFKNRNASSVNETWRSPEDLNLKFPARVVQLASTIETSTDAKTAFTQLDPSDEEFKQALSSVSISPSYEVLTTKTWRQPALPKNEALPVLIQAGDEFDGLYELEGTITVFVSRYLHVVSDLWLADYIQKVEPVMPWWQSNPLFGEEEEQVGQYGGGFRPYNEQLPTETITRYESVRTVKLNESRRMRSGELHYLDHPLFGLLVKVSSYDPLAGAEAEASK